MRKKTAPETALTPTTPATPTKARVGNSVGDGVGEGVGVAVGEGVGVEVAVGVGVGEVETGKGGLQTLQGL